MKPGREDYNRLVVSGDKLFDPEKGIADDEPVFLLRGQDLLATEVVKYWVALAERHGVNPEMVASARRHLDAMVDWQTDHNFKLPDQPPR